MTGRSQRGKAKLVERCQGLEGRKPWRLPKGESLEVSWGLEGESPEGPYARSETTSLVVGKASQRVEEKGKSRASGESREQRAGSSGTQMSRGLFFIFRSFSKAPLSRIGQAQSAFKSQLTFSKN